MSDEHDPAVAGPYGDDIVDTPVLDRLAADGITFENCYTTSPLCVPARLSFTAGQYISRFGGWSNACWIPSNDHPTLPRVLDDAGYEPILGGKMHYDSTRRYGFRELYDTPSNEGTKNGTTRRCSPDDETVDRSSWDNRAARSYVGDDSYVIDWDREVTAECTDFLRDRDPDDEPFFLLAGYLAPHFPLVAPFEYYEKYHGEVPLPEFPDGFFETLPTNYEQLRRRFGVEGVDHTGDQVRFMRELYWAFVDWMDDEIGKLLDALYDSAVAENTVVIYTSDHGENKGDHGMWWKNCMYDHGARIPLIVSWPERWTGGQRRTEACSLVDVVQTIADLADARVPDDWDGDSLVPWMDDPTVDWKDQALSEYYGHNIASGVTMYRSGRYKYVYHARIDDEHGPETELYDMQEDPREFTNLAHDGEYGDVKRRLHEEMVAELGEEPDAIERRCREDTAQPYDRPTE